MKDINSAGTKMLFTLVNVAKSLKDYCDKTCVGANCNICLIEKQYIKIKDTVELTTGVKMEGVCEYFKQSK